MRTDILERKKEIHNWISKKQSKAFMCKELGCRPDTLNWWLSKMGIDYRGNQSGKGIKKGKRKTAIEYIKSTHVSSHRLRIKLIEDGVKEAKCEGCRLYEWIGGKIPLELHHKDGNRYNNELDNLEILCPNCHSLTDSNSGKNKGTYK